MAPRKPPVTPSNEDGTITVKHKESGKTFTVSQTYYEANKHKLDVVEV